MQAGASFQPANYCERMLATADYGPFLRGVETSGIFFGEEVRFDILSFFVKDCRT